MGGGDNKRESIHKQVFFMYSFMNLMQPFYSVVKLSYKCFSVGCFHEG